MLITEPTQRISLLDTIRGICLLGILFINVQAYTLFDFLSPKQVEALHWGNPSTFKPAAFLLSVFIRGQFYTIYSFLFGLGFYLMLEKNARLELNGTKLYIRRLLIMFLFGAIHSALWFGDVLHMYAILGIPLIFFYKKNVSVIFRWVIGIFLTGILLDVFRAFFFPPTLPPHADGLFSKDMLHMVNTYQHGSFAEILDIQYKMLIRRWTGATRSTMSVFQHTFILFLLGLIAGKIRFFHRIAELQPVIKRVVLITLPFALAIKVIACLPIFGVHFFSPEQPVYERLIINMARFIGVLLMTVVYIGTFSLLLYKSSARLWHWVGNAGRLGLTNYLTQSVICMLLFYPFGLGLTGILNIYQSFLLTIVIYTVQVIYSNIWLRYYSMGPLEGVWRRFTYGRQAKPVNALS